MDHMNTPVQVEVQEDWCWQVCRCRCWSRWAESVDVPAQEQNRIRQMSFNIKLSVKLFKYNVL